MDLQKLRESSQKNVPYASRPGLAPITEAAYLALARASSCRGMRCVIGGEVHGLVKAASGLYVLAIGEVGGPIDPDVGGPIDPDIKAT